MRTNSSSSWTSNANEVFSRSSHEEDDEEALKWASLEKLPTFDRLKKGMLLGSMGAPAMEVEIKDLSHQDRQKLMERLIKVAEEDNEKFLLKLRDRIDRVGLDLPTIEVRYEHLSANAEAFVGGKSSPTFLNFHTNIIQMLLNKLSILSTKKKQVTILHEVSGIIKPCRMTLLLGPPGSGKTTFLLGLAGKLDRGLKCAGNVTYNGHGLDEFVPQRTAAYVSQHDLHIGEMTVRETLAFSARCQGIGSRYDMLAELSRREKEANFKPDADVDIYMKAVATGGQGADVVTEYVLKVMGLEVCSDTMVGDDMRRGISGGQRKLVTTGEMLVGPAKTLFMDEISTGLDSSTTYQIVSSLRHFVHILKGTAVICLLQPAPETYDLFDDIILLSEGIVVYQGPRENVLEFFESMGFQCPARKGVADFLQEVTSKKDQMQYWRHRHELYRFVTAREFSEAFQSSHVGRRLTDELSVPFDKSRSHPAALSSDTYGVSKRELLKACTEREILLLKRNSIVYVFKLVQLIVMSLITFSLFFRTNMHRDSAAGGGVYVGALFFGVVRIMFNGLSEVAMTIVKLHVFFKQRDLLFYPSWAYALPSWIVKIPITFIEVAVWVILTYYFIGFDPNLERFFKQYLLLLLVSQMAIGLFRAVAAAGRNMVVAYTFGAFALLVLFALGGFVLSRDDVNPWWIWGYWSSPMMYAMNAIAVNEFLGDQWSHVLEGDTEPLGVMILRSRGFFPYAYWYWIGVAALFGFILIFNISIAVALAYVSPFGKPHSMTSKEDESSGNDDQTGGFIPLASQERRDQLRSTSSGSEFVIESSENKKKGMILPFEPHYITFDDVKYSVDMPQEMKTQGVDEDRLLLLNGLSGAFRPGVLTALMGVTGAGKTTLLDVLAGRKTGGYIEGDIRISGYPKVQETFARISGYCEQNDIHSPHVTVYESLLYSAWLRLCADIDSKTREMFVDEVMNLVELNPLRNSLVGLPGVSGLSTEQRKRLTIAVELVANPSIIFMDEPTSGLDARAAAIVMRTVRNTVDTGRTVVCTIHQPSIDIFETFDELFLMKRGGQELYVGPVGRHSCELIKYFEDIEGVSKIKDGYNPATWMLEVSASSQESVLGIDLSDIYRNSELFRRNKELIQELNVPKPGSTSIDFPTPYSQSFLTQCDACLWKQRRSYWRNPTYTAVRFVFTTFLALIFGTLFWDLGTKTRSQQELFNAMGSMYTAVFFLGVQNSFSVQPVVFVERTVFYRERAAGMYSALPYAFAQVLVEVPYIFVQSVVYGVITYAMIGFEWTAAKFFWYWFFMFFTLAYFTFYGMMTVAVTPNPQIAAIIAASFYGLWNLFCGYIIPRPSMPIWWRWYYWACPVSWTLYGLIASQFGDVTELMTDGNRQSVKDYLKSVFGYEHDFVGVTAGVVVGLAFAFAIIFAFSIRAFNFQKR